MPTSGGTFYWVELYSASIYMSFYKLRCNKIPVVIDSILLGIYLSRQIKKQTNKDKDKDKKQKQKQKNVF